MFSALHKYKAIYLRVYRESWHGFASKELEDGGQTQHRNMLLEYTII